MRSHLCHGRRDMPRVSVAKRMTSNPSVVSGVSSLSGGVQRRGSSLPTSPAIRTSYLASGDSLL
ncbi:hypothetical protein IV77_GL000295 [Olsenella uli DSM 7084]|nr:hypothetical protein IV77_GL000295 [Olsenella uli DSM 7084]